MKYFGSRLRTTTRESATISCHFQITGLPAVFAIVSDTSTLNNEQPLLLSASAMPSRFVSLRSIEPFVSIVSWRKTRLFRSTSGGIEFQPGSTTFDKNLALGCTRCFRKDYGASCASFFRKKSNKSASLFPTSFRFFFRVLLQRAIFSPPYLATDRFQHPSRYLPFTIAIILRAFVIVSYGWSGARDVYFITVVALKSLPSPPEASSFFPHLCFSLFFLLLVPPTADCDFMQFLV